MKMKPGPKAILWMLMVFVLLGAGFWAGRGFPRTWQGVFRPNAYAAPAPDLTAERSADSQRMEALESRVNTLEQEVTTLRSDLDAARTEKPAPPVEDGPAAPTVQPQSSSQPADPDASPSIDYR